MDACVAGPVRAKEMDLALVSRMLADSAAIPFAVMQDGLISFANPAFMDLFRAGRNLAGTAMDELLSIQSRAAFAKRLSVPQNAPATFRGRAIRSGGPSFNIELHLACEMLDGVPMMGVFAEDVSLRQLSERHLSRLAYTDELTGLPNRAFLLDRLRDAIVAARKDGSKLAVLMADLDGLKPANDTLGHQGGDAVLQVTAQRFLACVRSSDTLARLGGDEFCVVLPRVRESGDTEAVAGRLLDAARRPIPVDGHQIGITVSIGIALYPDHGCTVDGVMKAADMALYAAKRGGRDRLAWASNSAAPNGFLLPPGESGENFIRR